MAFSRAILLLGLVSLALSCSVPPGGCKDCDNLKLGTVFGVYKGPSGTSISQRGAGSLNYERFVSIAGRATIVGSTGDVTPQACCKKCAQTTGCSFYHFYPTDTTNKPGTPGVYCYLLSGAYPSTANNNSRVPASYLGGHCNGAPGVVDDPHFTGAHGTRFDFNGEIDRPFCLVTDSQLNINVLLGGYKDTRTNGATFQGEGKAIRTWIREMAFLWRDSKGVKHTVHMIARKGKQQERGQGGFLESIRADLDLHDPPAQVGDAVQGAGGFRLALSEQGKKGPFDMDTYDLSIDRILLAQVDMRAAHSALQTSTDAYVHFNLHLLDISVTPEVHGVLGQTYRGDTERVARASGYSQLSKLLNGPIVADGESGKGFLDGGVKDYETSSLLATDCKFAQAWSKAEAV